MINMTEAPPTTQRLQLALNVKDLDAAIEFYTKMFGTEPARLRPGYANFAIANPPLKLILFEGAEEGTINHLGVEVSSPDEVIEAEQRLIQAGLETTGIDDTVCCYAEKTETWLEGPDRTRWEWYVRTGDSEQMANVITSSTGEAGESTAGTTCCAPGAEAPAEASSTTTCCG